MYYLISLPESKHKRYFSSVFFVFFVVFASTNIEKSMRDSKDLEEGYEFCGKVQSYYFSKPGVSIATWRIRIVNDELDEKVFEVGKPYIHKNMMGLTIDRGDRICINYLRTNHLLNEKFISQITIELNRLLDEAVVEETYLSPVSFFQWSLTVFFFLASTIFMKIKRGK